MEYEERFKQAVRVTGVGLFVNLGLTIFKLFAGIMGNSAAMVADAVHSLSDFLTDIVVIFGFKIARKPVDESHNYGHGKIETLSASLVGLMLLIVAGEILYYGLQKNSVILRRRNPWAACSYCPLCSSTFHGLKRVHVSIYNLSGPKNQQHCSDRECLAPPFGCFFFTLHHDRNWGCSLSRRKMGCVRPDYGNFSEFHHL